MLDIAIAYNQYKFLGNEFLTWLWFVIASDQQDFTDDSGNPLSFVIADKITCENSNGGEVVESIKIKGDNADLKEALVALDKGAWVSELRLTLMYSDLTWDFTIKGENFHLTGFKHPKVEQAKSQEDMDGAILEKVYLWSVVPDLVDRVFFWFLKNRLDPSGWEKTTKQMKEWIRSYD